MKRENKTRFGWGWQKSGRWRHEPFVFWVIAMFLILTSQLVQAQTNNPTQIQIENDKNQNSVDPLYPNWKRIWGLADFFSSSLFPALKAELKLTDEQIKTAESIQALLIENRQRESHNSKESMPWDPEDRKTFQDKCETEILKFRDSLGEEKFNDFCQYVQEETMIVQKIENPKNVFGDKQSFSDGLFNEVTDTDFYKSYKQKKIGSYISGHEKGLKLRIAYELAFRTFASMENKKSSQVKSGKKGRKQELNQILNELQNLN